MSEETEKKKQEYLELLSKAPARAGGLESLAHEIVQAARLTSDVVAPIRDLVAKLPAESLRADQWDQQLEMLRAWLDAAAQLEDSVIKWSGTFNATSYAVASTSTTAVFSIILPGLAQAPDVRIAQGQLSRVFEQTRLVDTARASMQRLGLDHRGGSSKAALDLLNEAKALLDRPSLPQGGSAAVLITLRESINVAISELIRRRPIQEPGPKTRDKILSLGLHCALASLQMAQFEALASDAEGLLNELSGAKQAEMSRQEVIDLFHRGVLFLDALLKGIDESRLRP